MTDASRAALRASLVAGPALWLSRAVVDRAGTGDGFRVAFLPSLPELAGLTVAAGLLLSLAGAGLRTWLARRDEHGPVDGRVLLPAWLLVAIAIPFVPFLANRLPAIDALAGPGRYWLWGLAAALSLWALGSDLSGRASAGRRRSALAIAALSAAMFAGAAFRLAPSALYPGGDEPHYLVIAQSLLLDGDLEIGNNHERGDYRTYFAGELEPHRAARGRGGVIYPVHPVALPVLVAPGFVLGGYRGASLTVVACAVIASLLLWWWSREVTGSASAAVAGWLAVASSAPFLLHSFAIHPDVPAAVCVLVVVGWRARRADTATTAAIRGLALAALPWLSAKYAPMSAGLLLLLLTRPALTRPRRLLAALPWVLSVTAWLGWFWLLWGVPSPAAPYGADHQLSLGHLMTGLPGLLVDQEYGIVAYAPALALAAPGWWQLWHAGHRRLVAETAIPGLLLALTVGADAMFWGGGSTPGRQVVAALPLLGLPIAWLYRQTADRPVQQAALVLLLAAGVMISATLVLAQNGLLIANGRDGAARLLNYLAPSGELVRIMPSLIRGRSEPFAAGAATAVWLAGAAAAWWAAGRARVAHRGGAGLLAGGLGLAMLLAVAVAVPLVARPLPPREPVEARGVVRALMEYDAEARPWALDYRPFRLTSPAALLPEFELAATEGLRRAPQPLRVLKNMRLALPPGEYRVRLRSKPGEALDGDVGLQVGRIGMPRDTWSVAARPGASWEQRFSLDLESAFVGFRASPAFDQALARVTVAPQAVVNAGERLKRPPVLGATRLGGLPFYFHDELAYAEPNGFWVRGGATLEATVRLEPGLEPPGVRLQVHSGEGTTDVRFATAAWSRAVGLTPGDVVQVLVPALPTQRLLALTIAPSRGFVPAEHGGAPGDRRVLGCWVEVLPR
ncbi:MAG TPA: hypothetical protein VF136_13120 [Methylomirabilota bacterium]